MINDNDKPALNIEAQIILDRLMDELAQATYRAIVAEAARDELMKQLNGRSQT